MTLSAGLWAAAPANAESVDLGLPSGLKWATFNVGATTPEGYGDYFAWGEIEPKEDYSASTYTYTDNPTTLPADHDAATANWGSDWRIPTKAEWEELISECTWIASRMSGIAGFLVMNKKDENKSIFLPIPGCFLGTSLTEVQTNGYYWSSSLDKERSDNASRIVFSISNPAMLDAFSRIAGYSIRPVYDPSEPSALPTLKNADKAPVRKYIKNGRFEMEVNGKKYNALGF